ncbi:hypothetical protein PQC16_gp195 [Rhizobium phage RHph_TM30]|uniref:Uncharacterized protein n=1 Tax=Rhizobium phage RHph_TM30 TaxID=2509764 RepID=A0A7S5R5D6_9CAUD|nr:hypothetical protein PQC16_gp195 [Rhizobium phage RHph_TM30]QIG71302.1 hypothetical protein EVB93_195 [Rhizobium phage RHph_TM30]QIG72391.1 hypothetical protein EVB96_195 [Rhizobium phage RHph_TM3_3_6]
MICEFCNIRNRVFYNKSKGYAKTCGDKSCMFKMRSRMQSTRDRSHENYSDRITKLHSTEAILKSVKSRGHETWTLLEDNLKIYLPYFVGMHNRVRDGKSPSIEWTRTIEGLKLFVEHIGEIPAHLSKPSVGRIRHEEGYIVGNVQWDEYSWNSVKRRGTRYVNETSTHRL